MFDPTNWWYYFEKTQQGKVAKCKNCSWTKDRSKDKSTNGLKYHLEHSHAELFSQKLEADRIKETKAQKKQPHVQQILDIVKKPKISLGTEIQFDEETPESSSAAKRHYPIFGNNNY